VQVFVVREGMQMVRRVKRLPIDGAINNIKHYFHSESETK
jgi:hypothetical protein